MKKFLLILTSIALLLAGCAKDESLKVQNEGEGTGDFTFSISVPDVETKAVADGDGKASKVNHWVMEVLDSDGERYNYQDKETAPGVLHNSFTVRLVKGQKYTVLFWADTKDTYDVKKLEEVKLLNESTYAANLDSRDAFSAVVSDFQTTQAAAETVTLKRAVSQMNIIFTDLKDLYETIGSDTEYAKFEPINFTAEAKVPTTFNVRTQEAGAPATTALIMTADSSYLKNYNTHREKETLFMDYIFSSAAEKDLVDIDFSFTSKGVAINHSFTSIPFQRNYRTNILGEFMSSNATWNVTIDNSWAGELDQQISMAGSIAAANEALKAGKTNISISSPADYSTSIALPAESNGKDIYFTLTGTSGKKISFQNETGEDGPANMFISADAGELDINTPKSHVEVVTGTYSKVTASTSATTLVIGKDVEVDSLNVTKGNIEIHGIVGTIVKPNASVVTYKIETAKVLRNVAAKIAAGISESKFPDIYIENDIDLNNEEWTPVIASCRFTIDGQNHAIKNLKVTDYTGTYIGLFSSVSGASISNLTIQNASMTNATTNSGARGGVLVGWSYACNIDNCHVINANITGSQKVAGILGAMSVEGSAGLNSVTNCSVKNLTMSENVSSDGLYQAGALVGYIQLVNANPDGVLIEKNKVENIIINNACGDEGNVPYYCGTFIGSIVSKQQVEGQSIRLNSNTISGTNTALFTSIYSSPYFGWATNAENYSGAIAPILIDGEKWTPDYAFECGGVRYNTLAQALAVVSASSDKTVRIIKAGEYTVQQLSASNCTIEATVDGVVFNHTPGSWITSGDAGTVTVKNIIWNIGTANHQMMYANLENCTVNGLFNTGGNQTFKNCKFINESDYNIWVYGTGATFEDCEFTCPGKDDGVSGAGSALNLYNEGNTGLKDVVVKNCKFTALNSTNKYSAIYIKPETDFNVTITNCTVNDNFCTGAISGSKIWNVKNNNNKKTTVTVDGKLVYANGAVLAISTPAQLQALAASVNAGNTFSGMTITLDADVDLKGIEWTPIGNVNKNFWGTFDGQGHTISNLTINNTATTENVTTGLFGWINTATIKNVNIDGAQISGHHDVGAIAGYMEANSTCTISGCNVTNAQISCTYGSSDADGDKCGGIVGFAGNSGSYVTNCTVTNTTIDSGRDAGQVAGAGKTDLVTGCSATNVTVTDNKTGTGANIRNEIIGRVL